MILSNPEYDDEVMLMQQIAKESETFRILLEGMVEDTDSEYPTNQAWLGTLALGKYLVFRAGENEWVSASKVTLIG